MEGRGLLRCRFARNMGRSLQEIAELGYTDVVAHAVGPLFQKARLYQTDPKLKYNDTALPPHRGQLVNRPNPRSFENDGHGLTSLAIYKLWQRLPDSDEWLRSHWTDVKAAGDWILGGLIILKSQGPGMVCCTLPAKARTETAIPFIPTQCAWKRCALWRRWLIPSAKPGWAAKWGSRADQMGQAITEHYVISDATYGRVWTLDHANWTHKSTVLGPLIFRRIQGVLRLKTAIPNGERSTKPPIRV